jgi:hypothetical protein
MNLFRGGYGTVLTTHEESRTGKLSLKRHWQAMPMFRTRFYSWFGRLLGLSGLDSVWAMISEGACQKKAVQHSYEEKKMHSDAQTPYWQK